jgi:hypothetical protein
MQLKLMRLTENESRFIGTKFEAQVELSQERSDVGNESQASEKKCTEALVELSPEA